MTSPELSADLNKYIFISVDHDLRDRSIVQQLLENIKSAQRVINLFQQFELVLQRQIPFFRHPLQFFFYQFQELSVAYIADEVSPLKNSFF